MTDRRWDAGTAAVTIGHDDAATVLRCCAGSVRATRQRWIGAATIGIGHLGPYGTLSAVGIVQEPGGPGNIQVGNCSPGSIDAAIGG